MLERNTQAPNILLSNQDNEMIDISKIRKKKCIFFYPKSFTPGCTIQVCSMQNSLQKFIDLGVEVFAISGDSVEKIKKFTVKYGIDYNILSDLDFSICKQYEVFKEKKIFGKVFKGIERSTFLLDANNNLRETFLKVSPLNHTEKVLTYFLNHQ